MRLFKQIVPWVIPVAIAVVLAQQGAKMLGGIWASVIPVVVAIGLGSMVGHHLKAKRDHNDNG